MSRLLRGSPWLLLLAVAACQPSEPMATFPDDYVLTVTGMT
jgi:hypothetical protein